MADNDIKDTELSSEQTAQNKKRTSKKKDRAENVTTSKPGAKKKANSPAPTEDAVEAPIESAEEVAVEAPIESAEEVAVEAAVESTEEEAVEAPIESSEEEAVEAPIESAEEEAVEAPIESAEEEVGDDTVREAEDIEAAESAEDNADTEADEQVTNTSDAEEAQDESFTSYVLDIEHFSDYKSVKNEYAAEEQASEDIDELTVCEEDAESEEDEEGNLSNEENLPDGIEYENLTILDHGLFQEAISSTEQLSDEALPAKKETAKDPDSEKYDPKKPRKVDGRFEFIELFVFTLVAVMIITTFFFRHSVVEGESMEDTLFANEHLIITDVFYKPKCGDIIVFEDYSTGYTTAIVKRVIATEGQTVRIAQEGVYVDGVFLDNEYYAHADTENYNYLTNVDSRFLEDYTIPEGEVFVMGDHRDHSSDSRTFGTIGEETILGKVILRFYPFNKFGSVYKDN